MTEREQSESAARNPAEGTERPAGSEPMAIVVNGDERRVPRGCTAAGLLRELGLEPGEVVVEVNRDIVRREELEETTLEAGDQVEVVRFVGGG